jgi:hypothetical protein
LSTREPLFVVQEGSIEVSKCCKPHTPARVGEHVATNAVDQCTAHNRTRELITFRLVGAAATVDHLAAVGVRCPFHVCLANAAVAT